MTTTTTTMMLILLLLLSLLCLDPQTRKVFLKSGLPITWCYYCCKRSVKRIATVITVALFTFVASLSDSLYLLLQQLNLPVLVCLGDEELVWDTCRVLGQHRLRHRSLTSLSAWLYWQSLWQILIILAYVATRKSRQQTGVMISSSLET